MSTDTEKQEQYDAKLHLLSTCIVHLPAAITNVHISLQTVETPW